MEQQKVTGQARILEGINTLSSDILSFREKCQNLRQLLDEGTYKIDAALNIIDGLKTQEKNILNSAGDPVAIKQMSAEQVEGILEMLKSPAFQNIARQVMLKWLNQDNGPAG